MADAHLSGSRAAAAPRLGFIAPQLPTLVPEPPAGSDWLHEIKYDGYRTQLVIDGSRLRAFTRNGQDWSRQYEPIITTGRDLDCTSAIIDGEMVVQDEDGRSDFGALRAAIGDQPDRLIFYAFDLLHLDGRDLRPRPLIERRALLRELIGAHDPTWPIQFSEHHIGGGAEMLTMVCEMGLEGIVSKKASSRYRSGRSTSWLKIKCFAEGEFVVIGAEHQPGSPAFALLARETDAGLEYAGSAFLTLAQDERDRFWAAAEQLRRDKPAVPMPKAKRALWMESDLRVSVQYLAGSDKLRHATVRELGDFLNSRPVTAPDVPEHKHFLPCERCGQMIDLRKLGDVLHHEQPDHNAHLKEVHSRIDPQ